MDNNGHAFCFNYKPMAMLSQSFLSGLMYRCKQTIPSVVMVLLMAFPVHVLCLVNASHAARGHSNGQSTAQNHKPYSKVKKHRLNSSLRRASNRYVHNTSKFFKNTRLKGKWAKRGAIVVGGTAFFVYGSILVVYASLLSTVLSGPFVGLGASLFAMGLLTVTIGSLEMALYGAIGGFALAGGLNLVREGKVKRAAKKLEANMLEKDVDPSYEGMKSDDNEMIHPNETQKAAR